MDKKQVITGTAVALILVLGYIGLTYYWRTTHPEWFVPAPETAVDTAPTTAPTTTLADATQPTTSAATNPATSPTTGMAAATAPSTQSAAQLTVPTAGDAAQETAIGSAAPRDAAYAMLLRLNPLGAGLDQVSLNGFKNADDWNKSDKDRRIYVFQEPYAAYQDTRPLATLAVTLDGQRIELWDKPWVLASSSVGDASGGASATYTTTINRSGAPVLKLSKTFSIDRKGDPSLGYEAKVNYTAENLTGSPIRLKTTFNGPTLPPRESSRPPDRQVMAGYADKQEIEVVSDAVAGFNSSKPFRDLTKTEKTGFPVQWAGTTSVYFSAFFLPDRADSIAQVMATGMDTHVADMDPEDRPVIVRFETPEIAIAPGTPASVPVTAYFGPRWREVLDKPHYTAPPRQYNSSLVIKTGPCARCTFDWLISFLVLMLKGFHFLVRDWGLAIIMLVGVVRTCLHPITKRSQIQMMKMGKMGPEMEKLKAKYKDDKEGLARAMAGFYKEQGMAPILGCLPMFLQMPIWIALYSSLQTTFELRQEPFLWGFTWIHDLAKPDYLFRFAGPLTLPFNYKLDAINLLPIGLAAVFYIQATIQQRLQPVGTPEQEQQKKMMKWMSLLFPVFLYNGPSGLNLYIFTSTFIGIVESKIIRKHIREREEAEKAGVVIIDAPPPPRSKKPGRADPEPPAKRGLMGWIADLQEKAEQVRKDQEKRGKGKM